jgi:Glycosyl transferases group 1
MFRVRGWLVVAYAVAPSLNPSRSVSRHLHTRISAALAQFGADAWHVIGGTPSMGSLSAIARLLVARFRCDWTLSSDLAVSDLVLIDDSLRNASKSPDLVVCNYLSGLSVADALAPLSRQILVLHDVPVSQLSPHVKGALSARQHLISLSATDATKIAALLPGSHCETGVPIGSVAPLGFHDIAAYSDLSAAVRASQPKLAMTWVSQSLDLLFVGGSHPPNLEGLSQFVETCFRPRLASHGVNLVVVGDAGPALWPGGDAPAGVIVLGRVVDLKPLYAAAKLVLVPLLSGTGISIKAVEAIALGKPVLATAIGLRGLMGTVDDFAGRDALHLEPPFDERWRDRILSLLGSRVERRMLRDRLRETLPVATLEKALAAVIGRIEPALGFAPISGGQPADQAVDLNLVDWSDEAAAAMTLLARSIKGEPITLHSVSALLRAPSRSSITDCEDLARDLYKAAAVQKFAPS